MQYEKEFMNLEMAHNGRSNDLLCALLFGVEGILTLGYFLSPQLGLPTLEPGYLWFYLSGMTAGLVFPALDRLARRREPVQGALRYTALTAVLAWSALFSAYDVRHGNGGWALSQIMLFTATALRLPKGAHYGINTAAWAFYILALTFSGAGIRALFSEAINSGVFLLIACLVIHINIGNRYASFLAARNRVQMRNDQLDAMAEQVEQLRHMADQVIVVRHDLRHFTWSVLQGAAAGDLDTVTTLSEHMLERLEQGRERPSVRDYTGVAAYDAVLSRYADWAGVNGVDYQVELSAPTRMQAADFAMVLMNALENAVHAVEAQVSGEERFIQVFSSGTKGQYYLEIANTCTPDSVIFQDGLPTTGQPGHGYGIKSIVSILDRYGAFCRFQAVDAVFRFQFLLGDGKAPDAGRSAGSGRRR